MNVVAAAWVPGLPHMLLSEGAPSYAELASACREVGDAFAAQGVERLLYYSTQWISVLGHLYQALPALSGLHVDDNWHDLPDLPFAFRIDAEFATSLSAAATASGFAAQLVAYDGFPVDTGTIVADHLVNRGRFRTNMVSSCVYADYDETARLGQSAATAIAASPVPTAVVVVSQLSQRFFFDLDRSA